MTTNSYFDSTKYTPLVFNSRGRTAPPNTIFAAIVAGFDKLPDPVLLATGSQYYVVDSGSANAYVISLSSQVTSYVAGVRALVKIAHTNTGASTINANSLGAKSILRYDGEAIQAGDLLANGIVDLIYDGTSFRIISNLAPDTTAQTRNDALWNLYNNADSTKKLAFDLSGITTATTRTLTVPDASGTMVLTAATQTLTNKTMGATTFTGAITYGGVAISNSVTGTGSIVLSGSPTLTGTLTAATANFSGTVGIGMTAANILDITQNQNAGSTIKLLNNSNLTGAWGQIILSNGTDQLQIAQAGTGFSGAFLSGGPGGVSGNITTTSSTPLVFGTSNLFAAMIGTDQSFLVGTTTNGGWGGSKFASEVSVGWAVSGYTSASSSGAYLARVNSTTAAFMAFYYGVSPSQVGGITTNGTTTTYGTISTKDVKDGIVPMDVVFARKMVAALAPSSYRHKADGSDGHGFVLELAHANALKYGVDLHKLGIVNLNAKVMDYGKVTPFLACVVINHEDRLAALERKLAE